MNQMDDFPFEVWFEGSYVNAFAGVVAACAKAELLGAGARVYKWIPERHVRVHLFKPGDPLPWKRGRE